MKSQNKIEDKSFYSPSELEEFRLIILKKIYTTEIELQTLQQQLDHSADNSCEETSFNYNEEEYSDALASKEELSTLALRQRKFKQQLINALYRIENHTYGRCVVTGKLIPKERLRVVPHTTHSIEAKLRYRYYTKNT